MISFCRSLKNLPVKGNKGDVFSHPDVVCDAMKNKIEAGALEKLRPRRRTKSICSGSTYRIERAKLNLIDKDWKSDVTTIEIDTEQFNVSNPRAEDVDWTNQASIDANKSTQTKKETPERVNNYFLRVEKNNFGFFFSQLRLDTKLKKYSRASGGEHVQLSSGTRNRNLMSASE